MSLSIRYGALFFTGPATGITPNACVSLTLADEPTLAAAAFTYTMFMVF
jgi:hypothetical protein